MAASSSRRRSPLPFPPRCATFVQSGPGLHQAHVRYICWLSMYSKHLIGASLLRHLFQSNLLNFSHPLILFRSARTRKQTVSQLIRLDYGNNQSRASWHVCYDSLRGCHRKTQVKPRSQRFAIWWIALGLHWQRTPSSVAWGQSSSQRQKQRNKSDHSCI